MTYCPHCKMHIDNKELFTCKTCKETVCEDCMGLGDECLRCINDQQVALRPVNKFALTQFEYNGSFNE